MQRSEKVDPGVAAVEAEGSYLERMLDQTQLWPMVEIPGWDEQVRIRPLGRGVEQSCHAKAAQWVKAQGISPDPVSFIGGEGQGVGYQMYGERAAALILYQALVTADSDPANPKAAKPLAESFDRFLDHPSISDIFLQFAWNEYERVKQQCSPYLDDIPVGRREALIAELKKNPHAVDLSALPRNWLETCLRTTGSLLAQSTGSNSSTTSSSSD